MTHTGSKTTHALLETAQPTAAGPVAPPAVGSESLRDTIFTALLQESDDLFAALDTGYHFVAFNIAYKREFDAAYGCDLRTGDLIFEHVHNLPGEGDRIKAHWSRALAGEKFRVTECLGDEARHFGHYDIRFLPFRSGDGSIRGAAHVVRNVTAQVHAEAELEKSKSEFESLANNIPQLAWMTDEHGEIFWYNQNWYDYTGTTLKQMQAESWSTVHHADHSERVTAKWTEHLRSGEPWEDTFPLRGAQGEWRWFLSRARAARGPDGRILHWFGTNTDVTEVKHAEERVLRERENIRDLFRQTPELVCILSGPSHLFEFVNEAHVRTLGFNATGLTVREAQPESVEVFGILDEVYKTGRTLYLHESSVTVGGRVRHFDLTYVARRSGGEVDGIMVLGNEITDKVENRQRVEELARSLQRSISARDEFLSIASHELKTPLTSLKLQAQLHERSVKRGDPNAYAPERVEALLALTQKQVTRLTRLVDDMLDVARIGSGRLSLAREPVDLRELLCEVVARLRGQFAEVGYAVPLVRAPEGLVGDWDRMRVEQVVTNLLTNAIRYGKRGTIDVEAQAVGADVLLRVRDHGIGIAAEAHAKIFERFERAVHANEVSGLGLGLYITKQIVLAHGGVIRVESEPGMGSSFTVALPRTNPDPDGKETTDVP